MSQPGRCLYLLGALALLACAGCGPREITAYRAGDTVAGRRFAITVHSVTREARIGLEGTLDPVADDAEQFIVIDATVMNTGSGERTFSTGQLRARVGGKEMVFDRETVAASEYTSLERIGPLASVRRKIAFRVPRRAGPPFTWNPGPSDVRIQLADAISVARPLGQSVEVARPAAPPIKLAVAAAASAPDVPLAYEMSYPEARRRLLEAGWSPAKNAQPERLESGARTLFQEGAIEVQFCAGTAVAPCRFAWNRAGGDQSLVVFTEGARPKVYGWTAE